MKAPTGFKGAVATALFGIWLSGCGGGGSGSEAQASPSVPTTGTVPTPTTSPGSAFVVYIDPIADGLLKGPLDGSSWTKITGFKTGKNSLTPLASGKQLAVYQDLDSQTEQVTVYDLKTGQATWSQPLPRNSLVEAGPVFGDPSQYLVRTITGTSDGNKVFVINLKAGSIIGTFASGGLDVKYDALPDGRLYRLSKKTGAISIAGADGIWSSSGSLAIPSGLSISSWRLNPQGTRLAIVYALNASGTHHTDVWIANIDGTSQYRVTNDGNIDNPVWSPDGSRIAFRYDTRSNLGNSADTVTGQCSYWHVPADSRDVAGMVKGQSHSRATQMNVNNSGIKDYASCDIVGWIQD